MSKKGSTIVPNIWMHGKSKSGNGPGTLTYMSQPCDKHNSSASSLIWAFYQVPVTMISSSHVGCWLISRGEYLSVWPMRNYQMCLFLIYFIGNNLIQIEDPNRHKALKSWREKRQGLLCLPKHRSHQIFHHQRQLSFLTSSSLLPFFFQVISGPAYRQSSQQALPPAVLPYASFLDNSLPWDIHICTGYLMFTWQQGLLFSRPLYVATPDTCWRKVSHFLPWKTAKRTTWIAL